MSKSSRVVLLTSSIILRSLDSVGVMVRFPMPIPRSAHVELSSIRNTFILQCAMIGSISRSMWLFSCFVISSSVILVILFIIESMAVMKR